MDTRLSLSEAQSVVAEQVASGLSVRDFCARRGLSARRLYDLRKRVRGAADAAIESEPRAVHFHEVMAPSSLGDGAALLRVVLPDGIRIELLERSAVTMLSSVALALRGGGSC